MRRLFVALSLLLAGALLGPAVVGAQEATPPAATAAIARTNIRYVSPFTPDGLNPALTVTATEDGVCGYPSSNALDRPDAWDCISESDQIYDPCFENPFVSPDKPGEVACFASPFSTDVVRLTLTEPLVREKDEPSGPGPSADDLLRPWDLPWALELANGEQCTLLGGTLTVVAGEVVHYGCAGGGSVLGETDRSQPVWVVSYIADGAYATTLVDVATAWS
jgi:hypothetical protein